MKLKVRHMVSLRATADSRHYQLQMMAAHAMNGRRQVIAMAEHSLKPQLVVAKLRATAMIFIAEFESALVAIAAIVAASAILVVVVVDEVAVNATVIMLAAVVNNAIKTVAVSVSAVVVAALIFLSIFMRSPQFELDQP